MGARSDGAVQVQQRRQGRGAHRNRGIEQRYALLRDGGVARCRPSRAELQRRALTGGGASGTDGKVIYPDRAAAESAAAALLVIDGDERQVYRCWRTGNTDGREHFHLTNIVPRRVRASIQAWRRGGRGGPGARHRTRAT